MSMRKIKEASFNKQELKRIINSYLLDINENFNSLLFKLSPLVYKFKVKSTNETLYGMKIISNKSPNLVIRFNIDLNFPDILHSISCWRNHYPINRKYPTPDFVVSGFREDQNPKEQKEILNELNIWIRRRNKQSYFLNTESILSIDLMAISDMYIQKEVNDIFNLSKDNEIQQEELSSNINDIKNSNDSIVLVLNEINTQEDKEYIFQEIKNNVEVISGINYFIKDDISTDELAISLWLNNKKNNDIIILDNFENWDNAELLSMINDIITKGELTYQFKNQELKPSDFPEDGQLNFVIKFIIITSKDESFVNTQNYTFLSSNTSYEEFYTDDNDKEIALKMNEVLPNFLPKMSSNFKKSTIREIMKLINNKVINITIPELALLLEVRLVCKNNWENYFKDILENLPKL
jgi:hypothetical protein